MSSNNIFERQTRYALRKYKCIPTVDADGNQYDNLVEFGVDRPFIFLHAFTMKKIDDNDRYSDLSQGYQNDLVFLDPHPVISVLQIAEVSSFHTAAGKYYVQDLRPQDGDLDLDGIPTSRTDYEQYVFVLLCLNY